MNDKDSRDMADLAFGGSSAVSGDASEPKPVYPDADLSCGLSTSGVLISGSRESINKVRDWLHAATAIVPYLRAELDEARAALASQASLAKRGTEPSDLLCACGAYWEPNGAGWKMLTPPKALRTDLAESAPSEKLSGAEADEEIEAVIACLGDDAAALMHENSESEVAANMLRAAELLESFAPHAETVPHVPAGQEAEDDLRWKFECFIDFATGGKLSKSGWALETLKAAVTEHINAIADDHAKELTASMQAEAPQAGWKLVPVEPTLEMCLAEWNVSMSDAHSETGTSEAAWRAMLNAAPEAPQARKDAEVAILRRFVSQVAGDCYLPKDLAAVARYCLEKADAARKSQGEAP